MVGEEFWDIVKPDRLRLAPPSHHLLQHTDHPFDEERRIHLDGQAFAYPFIQNVECPESSPAIQHIIHKVDSPHRVRVRDNHERLEEPDRELLLGPTRQIQP